MRTGRGVGPLFGILLIAPFGCDDRAQKHDSPGRQAGRQPASQPADVPLIDEADASHHFGNVVGDARTLTHRYRFRNVSGRAVKVVEVVNRKPCCGTVRFEARDLSPGAEMVVEVDLSLRQEFGEVVHFAQVVTDPPVPKEILLRTSATAFPPLRVEEVGPSTTRELTEATGPARVEFRAFAYGTATDPPADLDRRKLVSTVGAEWLGVKEVGPPEDGLRTESRRFAATLDGQGPPGGRSAAIGLADGTGVPFQHVVRWEVVAPVVVTPKVVVLQAGTREYHVLIRCRDRTPFRVTRVESGVPGVSGRPDGADPAEVHKVTVVAEESACSAGGRGTLTVVTDHPVLGTIEVPVVALD